MTDMSTDTTTDMTTDMTTEHAFAEPTRTTVDSLVNDLADAGHDERATYPPEWADREDPADWTDYTAPAAGDSRWVAYTWRDDDSSINDADCWGKVSQYAYGYNDSHESTRRPEGFDGSARKIQVDRGYWMWWQPYREGHKVYDSPEDVRRVRDLLEMGFTGLTVEREEMGPCGHWHTADVASVGGIDSLADGCLAMVLAELIDEVRPTD